jgi:ureidoglycolate hydrolase
MTPSSATQVLRAQPLTSEMFQPYGQVISATPDGKSYDAEDAQLDLNNGVPRFYIMRLYQKGRKFSGMTRHLRCTQCLGALEGKDWLIAVARPTSLAQPDLQDITAFRVPGSCFIKLDLGTWHAGPYFNQDFVDFYNLELSDTNVTDHQTCSLLETFGLEFEIEEP